MAEENGPGVFCDFELHQLLEILAGSLALFKMSQIQMRYFHDVVFFS